MIKGRHKECECLENLKKCASCNVVVDPWNRHRFIKLSRLLEGEMWRLNENVKLQRTKEPSKTKKF